jgi:RNA polymerase sigma-70 factor (ECF subfamily)
MAFAELFRNYWPCVYAGCLRLTKSPEQAKDLAQDIFLRLWDHRLRLAEVQHLDAFLYTISHNLLVNHFRKKVLSVSNTEFLADHFRQQASDPRESLEYKDLECQMQVAINQLPPRVKEVFLLHRVQGLNHGEISEMLNISVVSSKTYIVRALKNIRAFLSHRLEVCIPLLLCLLDRYFC